MPRFTADGALELIARERVTVVCCVSTQFIMMLNSPPADTVDLSSRRCVFTGAGPATCLGYFADPDANAELFTPDGWMLTGDICTIDDDGYLRVVDRKSDFIIRGGKNISAAAVEDQVGSQPAVAMVAAVAMPDPTYGERVCAFIVLRPGSTVDLDGLRAHLRRRGVFRENWPERLECVPDLPRGSGGKVAKSQLRESLRRGPRPAPSARS